ncbi:MAG: sodium:solute symporter family protein [Bacteroidales bacterium]|nr:sodium:solute symporter family protein [Bacteroidales bacterium]
MWGLNLTDILVILGYFSIIVFIGFWSMRRIKNQEDFFLGGRRFGRIIQVFGAFGQATSADTGPSVATTTANNGASGIWSALMMLFSTPSYWLVGPWYRRLRVMTMGDFFTERYSSKFLGGVYSVMASVSLMLLLTVGFISMTKTVTVMTPKSQHELTAEETKEYARAVRLQELGSYDYTHLSGAQKDELEQLRKERPRKVYSHISRTVLIWVMVVIVCLYSVAGGLEAAFISDLIQGVFIIILSLLLLPFSLARINEVYGGNSVMDAFRTLHDRLPESFFDIFGSPASIDFTWYYILALGIMATINVAAGANQLTATASAKNEYAARFGLTYGTYLKRITTVFWGVTALAIVLLFGKAVNDPDLLWGYASHELLGKLNFGLVGLMIASLMAALMSTADLMMLTCAGLITHNIYKPLVKGKTEKHYINTGRVMGASIVVGAALIVMVQDNLFNQLKFFWEWGVVFSAGFWMGILYRKANRKGTWYSILLTLLVFFLIPLLLPKIFTKMKTDKDLLLMTNSSVVERTYTAKNIDVEERKKEIARWETLDPETRFGIPAPAPLKPGESFTRQYKLPEKSVFWTNGVQLNKDGVPEGRGIINLELVLLKMIGFDLEKNPYALNETIRILIRTIIPFLILYLISRFSSVSDTEKAGADRFLQK